MTPFQFMFAVPLSLLALASCPARAEDIDIFVGGGGSSSSFPNVLIVLDNSANWSANNQGWPNDTSPPAGVNCGSFCDKQGYYELKALRTVINGLPTDASGDVQVNVGLMMFNASNSTRSGGYVRSRVQQLTAVNKAALTTRLDAIMNNGNGETGSSSVEYSAILWDVFKYFGGYTYAGLANKDQAPTTNPVVGTVPVFGTKFYGTIDGSIAGRQDPLAYTGSATTGDYVPVSGAGCNKNYVIFIGNGFPSQDSVTIAQVLKYLSNPSVPPAAISEFKLPTFSCGGTWTNAVGHSCGGNCAGSLPASSETMLYQCAKSNCTGSNARVQECSSVSVSLSAPAGNAQTHYGDEFADFLYRTDVSSQLSQQNVIMYTVNVFKNQPSTDQAALLRNMAYHGGGKYFVANDLNTLVKSFNEIFTEILAVSSTFASASLPINTANRSQNLNQVYLPQFRPDPDAKPRWFGNLKRYQLISNASGDVRLGDASGNLAVDLDNAVNGCSSSSTSANCAGYIDKCAVSFWTTDALNAPGRTDNAGYWTAYTINPSPASPCNTAANLYSDLPDGRQVEKGAVAEVIRKGNNPPTTNITPSWTVTQRNIYTASGTSIQPFNATTTGLSSTLVSWMLGQDTEDENLDGVKTHTRASVHGDVVHSRPLPVDYGSGNVVVYYGANDGTLRAVDASNGQEKWAFVAPEFNSKLNRMRVQTPLVSYPGVPASLNPQPRDYFFDGSIGLFQGANNSPVMIYPTMRRGGRMVYAMDVTNSGSPSIAWKFGCDASGACTAGASNIGQTWSIAQPAFVKDSNASTSTYPMVMFGGGYDTCEDANTATPSCGSAKGAAVYALDAVSGSGGGGWLWSAATLRSVVGDISYVDLDHDGLVDHAYAVDTGGNIYRISFVDANRARLGRSQWKFTRIAHTAGGRKFLYAPAVVATRDKSGKDYVYLAVGSGDREHPLASHYPYTASVTNKLFVLLDDVTQTSAIDLDDVSTGVVRDCTVESNCASIPLLPGGTARAWFMDLTSNGQGEQTVTSPLIVTGQVVFSTNRPTPAPPGSCSPSLGEARGYWVDLLTSSGTIGTAGSTSTGIRSGTFVGGGLPPSPVIGTVPLNGVPTTVVIGAVEKGGGLSSPINAQKPIVTSKAPRRPVYRYFKNDK